jgi:hypothetical protein
MNVCRAIFVAAISTACFAGAAEAAESSYSKAVQKSCKMDYKKFCGDYGLETAALRNCMDRNGEKLSNSCVNALVASGEVSKAEVDRRKKKAHKK